MSSIARRDGGFTLAELLIVMIIIGVISAVAVPLYINSRTNAGNTAAAAAIDNVSTALDARIIQWQGLPPYSIGICTTAATYPTNPAPANVCNPQKWEAARLPTGTPVTPPLYGTLPEGVTVQGAVDNIGRYCLDGASDIPNTDTWYRTSDMSAAAVGTCYSQGWTANSGSITPDSSIAPNVEAPTGLFFTTGPNGGKLIKWEAVAGEEYLVTFEGQNYKIATPNQTGTATCAFPNPSNVCESAGSGVIEPGLYVVGVRQLGPNGWGAAAVTQVNVN